MIDALDLIALHDLEDDLLWLQPGLRDRAGRCAQAIRRVVDARGIEVDKQMVAGQASSSGSFDGRAARGEIHAEGQLDWWLYFTGLLAEAPLCLRAAHYLEALRAGPYAEDRGGDRIVGLGTRFQAEQLRAGWRATPISPAVGQRQCGGAPRSAEILLSLVRDQDPRGLDLEHRARMADVAGRLARVR